MLTLQRRQLAGHDILLARHGNHISTMRVDRGAGRVVALLDDGTTDSAPNVIFAGFRMSDTIPSVLLEDWKYLAIACGCWTVFTGLMFAGAVALAGLSGNPDLAQLLASYPVS
jgi:hypothetical protein